MTSSSILLKKVHKKRNPDEGEELIRKILSDVVKIAERRRTPTKGKAIWTWGRTVVNYGIDNIVKMCIQLNIKHIFLLVKGVSGKVTYNVLQKLLPIARENDIYVHAWIVCFEDQLNPNSSPDSPAYRKYLLEIIGKTLSIDFQGYYIDGVHLDYIRFHGYAWEKWNTISIFVGEVREIIDKFAPKAILSIASKAEKYSSKEEIIESALFYGQKYRDLARCVDVFCPMTYYLDYGVKPEDVGKAAKWIKEETRKPVFAGIQLHPSENPTTKGRIPTTEEVENCLKSCENNEVDGVVFFEMRYLIENYDKYANPIKNYFNT